MEGVVGTDLFIVVMDRDGRHVARERRVQRGDESADGPALAGVVVRVVAADHPLLGGNLDAPRLGAQLGGHLDHHFGGNRG